MKKNNVDEMVRQFVASGGKITVVPADKIDPNIHTITIKTPLNYDILSLGDGEFYFGETRKRKSKAIKKKSSVEDFNNTLHAVGGLPANVIEDLKRSMRTRG